MTSRADEAFAAAQNAATRQNGQAPKTLRVTQLSTVKPTRVDFFWKPFLPKGRPVSLEGDPGVGKSALVAKLFAHLTTGRAFPNVLKGAPAQDFAPHNVCLLSNEDDAGDTILPRVTANGGDPSRVYLIDGWELPDGQSGVVTMQDLDLLKAALDAYQPALLVFDPFQAYFGRKVDMNHANDTRPILDAIALLCRDYHCTPLYVRHWGKTLRKALHAGLGSIDILANVRSSWDSTPRTNNAAFWHTRRATTRRWASPWPTVLSRWTWTYRALTAP
jgi:hypothetical protein